MRIAPREYFLFCQKEDGKGDQVSIHETIAEGLRSWNATTRVSPIFFILRDGLKAEGPTGRIDMGFIVFVGPLEPLEITPILGDRDYHWISIGLFNNIVWTRSKKVARSLAALAQKNKISSEAWAFSKRTVKDTRVDNFYKNGQRKPNFSTLARLKASGELAEVIREYLPLAASTFERAAALPRTFQQDLSEFLDFVNGVVREAVSLQLKDGYYERLGEIQNANAALSRFSSQTFAGFPPIRNTECHLWSHSLLGIGIVTLAIKKFLTHWRARLGGLRLHDQFEEYCRKQDQSNNAVPDIAKGAIPVLCYVQPRVDATKLPKGEPQIPLLPYFSARDDYRSNRVTISAPLAIVTSANSSRWSILTLTHELGHILAKQLLAKLIPDLRESTHQSLREAVSLVNSPVPSRTLFGEMKRAFLVTMLGLAVHERIIDWKPNQTLSIADVRLIAIELREDVDEVMAHAFDYLYFYKGAAKKYVTSIWLSWGRLPNVHERIRKYLVRTVCAVLSDKLSEEEAEQIARDLTLDALKTIKGTTLDAPYVDEAVEMLENHWLNDLELDVRVRRKFVQFVYTCQFSEEIRARLVEDDRHSKYDCSELSMDGYSIESPINFAGAFTQATRGSAPTSTWIFHVMAFGVRNNG